MEDSDLFSVDDLPEIWDISIECRDSTISNGSHDSVWSVDFIPDWGHAWLKNHNNERPFRVELMISQQQSLLFRNDPRLFNDYIEEYVRQAWLKYWLTYFYSRSDEFILGGAL